MRAVGFIVAIVFAAAAFFLALNVLGGGDDDKTIIASPKGADVETVSVLVAAKPIDLGDVLSADMVKPESWPKHLLVDGFVTTSEQSTAIVGRVSRSTFVAGEPINTSRLSNPEDPSFIAAALPSGMRMVTVSSDAVAGLAGFVYPGDRVDVVVTRKIRLPKEVIEDSGVTDTTTTETLVNNVKVLAVNQLATIETEEEQAKRDKRERLPSSISLEVTLEDAQRMRLSQESGYLSLALRSLKDKDGREEPVVTTFNDISVADLEGEFGKKEEEEKEVVSLVRGIQKTDVEVPKLKSESEHESNDEIVE
jgi:Flp pilus assembly protein CpaB